MRNHDDEQDMAKQELIDLVSATLRESVHDLRLNAMEVGELIDLVHRSMQREFPMIVRRHAIMCSISVTRERDYRYFKLRGVPHHHAEDLAQTTALKILKCLRAQVPRGNLGAWRTAVRKNVLRDYLRRQRTEKRFWKTTCSKDETCLKTAISEFSPSVEDYVGRLTKGEIEIVSARLRGESWRDIGRSMGTSAYKVKTIAHRAWPSRCHPFSYSGGLQPVGPRTR